MSVGGELLKWSVLIILVCIIVFGWLIPDIFPTILLFWSDAAAENPDNIAVEAINTWFLFWRDFYNFLFP